ncbi:preprotein translocase subunit SecY [Nafulsella turpanensis]|uniref:preprotein translocase subunit SecY n=1 Tax=Nafulsella turpanensis TaxID=1265690 RepID=UPI00034C536C|nr:preprotein translocase subunit SecY [Nafulsella turpanensis]
MKKFFSTIRNIFTIEELRTRIFNTLGFLLIFRLGSFVVLPGIDPNLLDAGEPTGIFALLNTFLGGAFSRASIFALGIMPYISASIVVQLLTVAVPYFQKLQKDGESGRKKINQITRVLTIAITIFQASAYLTTIPAEAVVIDPFTWRIASVIIITGGTLFCMWLGEKITDKGIGNGISMLIMIGIIAALPGALIAESVSRGMEGMLLFIIELAALFFVVMGVVLLTQATRRIPVQYAKQVIGGKVYGGQRQYIPLKVNASGVMPIIFAQSLMFIPGMVAGLWADESDIAASIGATFSTYTSWQYNLVFALLIIIFTFFYTAITVNPNQIADDLKRNGGFVPGIKPGRDTSNFIDNVLSRITLPGSIFLAIVAILPAIATLAGVNQQFAQFYGGTSLLIMVGVVLDTLNQIESYLLMRHYEGMMKSGKIKGRSENVAVA